MRPVIVTLFASLDGYASDAPDEEMRWVNDGFGEDMTAEALAALREVDTPAVRPRDLPDDGRVLAVGRAEEGEFAGIMNGIPKVVFSTTLTDADVTWSNAPAWPSATSRRRSGTSRAARAGPSASPAASSASGGS